MLLNPKRILTTRGMRFILDALQKNAMGGPFNGCTATALLSANVAPDQRSLTTATMGADGLDVSVPLVLSAPVFDSESGKTYRVSSLMAFEVNNPQSPQTIVGIMIGDSNAYEDAYAYVQLDQPATLSEDAEALRFAIEFGFDGQQFYIRARVLPVGD